jgi:hypothetical protein
MSLRDAHPIAPGSPHRLGLCLRFIATEEGRPVYAQRAQTGGTVSQGRGHSACVGRGNRSAETIAMIH